jgi:hypothetical protein
MADLRQAPADVRGVLRAREPVLGPIGFREDTSTGSQSKPSALSTLDTGVNYDLTQLNSGASMFDKLVPCDSQVSYPTARLASARSVPNGHKVPIREVAVSEEGRTFSSVSNSFMASRAALSQEKIDRSFLGQKISTNEKDASNQAKAPAVPPILSPLAIYDSPQRDRKTIRPWPDAILRSSGKTSTSSQATNGELKHGHPEPIENAVKKVNHHVSQHSRSPLTKEGYPVTAGTYTDCTRLFDATGTQILSCSRLGHNSNAQR